MGTAELVPGPQSVVEILSANIVETLGCVAPGATMLSVEASWQASLIEDAIVYIFVARRALVSRSIKSTLDL